MKTNISLLLFLLIITLCACSSIEEKQAIVEAEGEDSITDNSPVIEPEIEIAFEKASYVVTYKSLTEIEDASELVVLVTMVNSQEIRFNEPNIKEGIHPISYALTSVRIDAIYKSNDEHDIGDVVKIEEYYSTAPHPTKENIALVYSIGFYIPMVESNQYILFLKKPQYKGDYEIVRFDLGKYTYSEKVKAAAKIEDLSFEELEIGFMGGGNQTIPDEYFVIANEIKKKYLN